MLELLITGGDPGGIGPELILKTLQHLVRVEKTDINLYHLRESLVRKMCKVTVFTSKEVLESLIRKYDLPLKILENFIFCEECPQIRFFLPDIENDDSFVNHHFGKICKRAGKSSWRYIQESIEFGKRYIRNRKKFCIFNLPVCKESIEKEGEKFLGHTEEYARAFGIDSYAMSFVSPQSSLVLMTTHVPLSKVSSMITSERIKNTFYHAKFLQKITGDTLPLLVLGLNPHAGDGGLMGTEEILMSEIREQEAPDAVGPISPDVGFLKVVDGSHKTVIACYHDQGLIPMKLLNRFESCNYTLGLPFIRTSVDHGTAFDIAGRMECDEKSTLYSLGRTYQLSLEFSNSLRSV